MIGKTLSHYKVIEKIGQGGMGEVYRAEDTNLSREVAIKVLPEQFTQDPQRLARFEREAKLLASLNHPNIAAIHSFEHADDVHFLVLELVPGETLQERVAKGPVPVEEALEVCRQIAEGMEAAHEKGVIHRDLKPANVKVTPEGKVKILDFGLAKAFEEETPVTDISQSPTLTEEMTRAGVILGTAAYMSPEQAKGKPVDKRADVFAFGAILYELLTGKRAFQGESITETLASILKGEPDWKVLPQNTPTRVRELMDECLEKEADDRLRDIGHARLQIKKALKEPAPVSPVGGVGAGQPALWKRAIPWSVVGVTVVVAAVVIWSLTSPPPQTVITLTVSPPPTARLANTIDRDVVISPDGNYIVYNAVTQETTQLYLRPLQEAVATPIPGTKGAMNPFFSPDSQSLAFFSDGQLRRTSLLGGTPITLADASSISTRGSWGTDGWIVFSGWPDSTIYRVSATGGEPEHIATPDSDKGESQFRVVQSLPGGKNAFFNIEGPNNRSDLALLSLETGDYEVVLEGANGVYLPTGHLIYLPSGGTSLMAVAFDLNNFEAKGEAVSVLEIGQRSGSFLDYSVSNNGTLVYASGGRIEGYSLVWVDRNGTETLVTEQKRNFATPRISPDGKSISVTMYDQDDQHTAIYDVGSDSFSRLTFEGTGGSMGWSPDGKWIAFLHVPQGIFLQPADRSAPPELLCEFPCPVPSSWSPDSATFAGQFPRQSYDIGFISIEKDAEPQFRLAESYDECCPKFSPDGRWLAYVSNETGQYHVYVRPYPALDVKFSITGEEGGGQPVWSPDGKELYYRSGNKMMVVDIQTSPAFQAGKPRELFEGVYLSGSATPGYQYYDITPDGERFVMIKEGEQSQINVVLNWFEELKRLVPTE